MARARYYFKHKLKGLYLGSGRWTNDPSGQGATEVPTYSLMDLHTLRGAGGDMEGLDVTDPDVEYQIVSLMDMIDLLEEKISEENAVKYKLVSRPWSS